MDENLTRKWTRNWLIKCGHWVGLRSKIRTRTALIKPIKMHKTRTVQNSHLDSKCIKYGSKWLEFWPGTKNNKKPDPYQNMIRIRTQYAWTPDRTHCGLTRFPGLCVCQGLCIISIKVFFVNFHCIWASLGTCSSYRYSMLLWVCLTNTFDSSIGGVKQIVIAIHTFCMRLHSSVKC